MVIHRHSLLLDLNKNLNYCEGNIKITVKLLTFSIDLINFLEVLQVSQPGGNKQYIVILPALNTIQSKEEHMIHTK